MKKTEKANNSVAVAAGQVWRRRKDRSENWPHILVLRTDLYRWGVPVIQARLYNANLGVIGPVTVYIYPENLDKGYEYHSLFRPDLMLGDLLKKRDRRDYQYMKVLSVSEDYCIVRNWDRVDRCHPRGSRSRVVQLDASFYEKFEVPWKKQKK